MTRKEASESNDLDPELRIKDRSYVIQVGFFLRRLLLFRMEVISSRTETLLIILPRLCVCSGWSYINIWLSYIETALWPEADIKWFLGDQSVWQNLAKKRTGSVRNNHLFKIDLSHLVPAVAWERVKAALSRYAKRGLNLRKLARQSASATYCYCWLSSAVFFLGNVRLKLWVAQACHVICLPKEITFLRREESQPE